MHVLKSLKLAEGDAVPLEAATQAFLPLIPSSLHTCLRGRHPAGISDSHIIAIGASDEGGHPVGIALAASIDHLHMVDVLHLFVDAAHRGRHIGRQLLTALQAAAKAGGGKLMTLTYAGQTAEAVALEKVLAANAWNPGQPFILRCQFDGFAFDPPWIHKKSRYPAACEVVPLCQLAPDEKQELRRRERNGEFPSLISPFIEEERIEPLNSLALKHRDRVVAWVVTHRLAPDTIRYTALYAERWLHFQGYGVQLLIDSIWLQKQSSVKWAVFELPLRQVSNSWTRFVKRRLVPYADVTTQLLQAWRTL